MDACDAGADPASVPGVLECVNPPEAPAKVLFKDSSARCLATSALLRCTFGSLLPCGWDFA